MPIALEGLMGVKNNHYIFGEVVGGVRWITWSFIYLFIFFFVCHAWSWWTRGFQVFGDAWMVIWTALFAVFKAMFFFFCSFDVSFLCSLFPLLVLGRCLRGFCALLRSWCTFCFWRWGRCGSASWVSDCFLLFAVSFIKAVVITVPSLLYYHGTM